MRGVPIAPVAPAIRIFIQLIVSAERDVKTTSPPEFAAQFQIVYIGRVYELSELWFSECTECKVLRQLRYCAGGRRTGHASAALPTSGDGVWTNGYGEDGRYRLPGYSALYHLWPVMHAVLLLRAAAPVHTPRLISRRASSARNLHPPLAERAAHRRFPFRS